MIPLRAAVLSAVVGRWGMPPDAVAWAALAAGGLAALLAVAPFRLRVPPSWRLPSLLAAAFAALLLSALYVHHYLRGGPRIIDATTYFLQARALAEGHFAWQVPEPLASFRGRFLLASGPSASAVAGIFPPGYPALLALGMRAGAPLAVGPVLAALLVLATAWLARELAREEGLGGEAVHLAAGAAATVSLACSALRYHTADTMSHGASALAVVIACAACLRGARATSQASRSGAFAVAGLAVGFVAATRFASALPVGALATTYAFRRGPRAVFALALGAVPFVALLAWANAAVTGDPFASLQRAYYAVSDGPPGCFGYGFGTEAGCRFEHGEYVRTTLPRGFGLLEAAVITAHRLRLHAQDVANFEPLVFLVGLGAFRAKGFSPRACLALVAGQVAAYVPFYFDGSYPGGGARFYADVLPVEHALMALALARFVPQARWAQGVLGLAALSSFGFAFHAAFDHLALANRDGGGPMFLPGRLAAAGVRQGLLFVDTDHGWNLAHDPEVASRVAMRGTLEEGLLAARYRHDDHDRLLFEQLGRPESYLYSFDLGPRAPGAAEGPRESILPFVPAADGDPRRYRFEAEADWPPLDQTGGWVEPEWVAPACASQARALSLRTLAAGTVSCRTALPVPNDAQGSANDGLDLTVAPRLLDEGDLRAGTLEVRGRTTRRVFARWSWGAVAMAPAGCRDLEPRAVRPAAREPLDLVFTLDVVSAPDGTIPKGIPLRPALDATVVERAEGGARGPR